VRVTRSFWILDAEMDRGRIECVSTYLQAMVMKALQAGHEICKGILQAIDEA
jgi:hypothetical protein